jgi:hypothetical protein
MKTKTAGLFIGILIIVAILLGFRLVRDLDSGQGKPEQGTEPVREAHKPVPSSQDRPKARTSSRSADRIPSPTAVDPELADAEISRLLSDDKVPVLQAAKGLLAIAADSRVATKVRADALQHGLNLTNDEDYAELVMPELEANHFESPEMHRIALDDAYNRDDIAKLPSTLALMKHTTGEMQKEAIELIAFITSEDEAIGLNYDKWSSIVTEHLLKNAEEE